MAMKIIYPQESQRNDDYNTQNSDLDTLVPGYIYHVGLGTVHR